MPKFDPHQEAKQRYATLLRVAPAIAHHLMEEARSVLCKIEPGLPEETLNFIAATTLFGAGMRTDPNGVKTMVLQGGLEIQYNKDSPTPDEIREFEAIMGRLPN